MAFEDVIQQFESGWRPSTIREARLLRRAIIVLSDTQLDLSKKMADVLLATVERLRPDGMAGDLDSAEAYSTAGTAYLPDEKGVNYLNIALDTLRKLVGGIPMTIDGMYNGREIRDREVAELRPLEMNVLIQYVRTNERLGYYYLKSKPAEALGLLWDASEALSWLNKTTCVSKDDRLLGTLYTLSFRAYENMGGILARHTSDLELASDFYVIARGFGDKLKASWHMDESCEEVYNRIVTATGGVAAPHSKA
ncbi:MAG: hypothetical protein HY438_02165 [DPANN group archaeon]|nr:hypothetical protein [DPANN group archaeon]